MLAIFFLFPLYWIVMVPSKSAIPILTPKGAIWFPQNPTVGNLMLGCLQLRPSCGCSISCLFLLMAMLLTCITAALAGYALGKKGFYCRAILFTIIICAMALPKHSHCYPSGSGDEVSCTE